MRLLALLACLATLQVAPIFSLDHTAIHKPIIELGDYFQIPADMIDQFPRLQNSETLQQSAAFAHIMKDQESHTWTTHRTSRSIQISSVLTKLSFFTTIL